MPKSLAHVNVTHLKAKWEPTVLLSVVFPIHLGVDILCSGEVKIY